MGFHYKDAASRRRRGRPLSTEASYGLRLEMKRPQIRTLSKATIDDTASDQLIDPMSDKRQVFFPLQLPSFASCTRQFPDWSYLDTAHTSGRHLRGDLDSIV
jgi:hypothetical protein